ncbi:hypothetical protein [Nostoc sp. CHAB 5715]|uniref:hypothetical protein n=1 Tax=Nostoc sp. CHAB 5715 TaxID=2780400 RepID=UPI001E654DBB|nr:hypothetical protein [Nostoc sp. CHAB 5715]MCC5623552.1 hypothetical protein [Nostoc sp. CHAB 5715]
MRDSRREGLIKFFDEFITLLEQESFSFQDLLEALAAWMFRQRPNPEEVIKHLEDAALELHRASRN